MKSISIALAAFACGLLLFSFASPASAQLGIPGLGKGKSKDNNKDKKDTAAAERNSDEFYLDMKDFAEGLYNKQPSPGQDSDFKRRVDSAYEELKRRDAEEAYKTNLSAHSEVVHAIEDRFRVYKGLYDNLLVQDLLNRTGQSIIPKTSDRLYTFKLLADPIPRAYTLSTGTIYVSTGLVALLSTKAQLAYVLAHEAAHVYHNDYKTEIMLNFAADEYAADKNANREVVMGKLALITGIGGAVIGGIAGQNGKAAVIGGVAGAAAGAVVGGIMDRETPLVKDWNKVQEDEADKTAFEWVLNANLDVQEIPKVYQALKDAGDRDERVTLGFLGRSNRVRERAKKIDEMITLEKGKAEFGQRKFQVSDPDFDILMAEVKRDNGVIAYQYDMLDMAKDNLQKAVAIKSSDPEALYFYAKILKETAKTDDERRTANQYFLRAAQNDHRHLYYGADLHRAVALLKPDATQAEKNEAVALFKQYLENYYFVSVQDHENQSYPPHLETIYDYMGRLGDFEYVLDGKKVLAQHEQAQKLQQAAGGAGIQVKSQDDPSIVPQPGSPKPTPVKPAATKKQ